MVWLIIPDKRLVEVHKPNGYEILTENDVLSGGDVAPGARISGSPAFDAKEWLRAVTAFPKLPELLKSVRELKKKVESFEKNVKPNPTE